MITLKLFVLNCFEKVYYNARLNQEYYLLNNLSNIYHHGSIIAKSFSNKNTSFYFESIKFWIGSERFITICKALWPNV